MSEPKLFVEKVFKDAKLPERAYPTDSGLDIFIHNFEKIFESDSGFIDGTILRLNPNGRALINTGIKVTVGPGYEIQVRPRSGLALKKGLTVLNTPGTIDEQYRGFIGVILINLSKETQIIEIGEKIAQLVVNRVILSEVELVDKLPDTQRGSGGFGSTGV